MNFIQFFTIVIMFHWIMVMLIVFHGIVVTVIIFHGVMVVIITLKNFIFNYIEMIIIIITTAITFRLN